MLTDILIARKL